MDHARKQLCLSESGKKMLYHYKGNSAMNSSEHINTIKLPHLSDFTKCK